MRLDFLTFQEVFGDMLVTAPIEKNETVIEFLRFPPQNKKIYIALFIIKIRSFRPRTSCAEGSYSSTRSFRKGAERRSHTPG